MKFPARNKAEAEIFKSFRPDIGVLVNIQMSVPKVLIFTAIGRAKLWTLLGMSARAAAEF